MGSNSTCQICLIGKSKYSCPRCHVLYCSALCYKSDSHLDCSEMFFEEWVQEELKNCQSNPEAKRRILEILRKHQETNSEENLDSDDDEAVPDLATRMTNVNLDDEKAVWEKLSVEEKQEFRKLVRNGRIINMLPEWEPWWITKKRKTYISDCDENHDWKCVCPAVPSEVPQLSQLTKVDPSPYVAFMLLNVIISYVYTVRWFRGAHKALPVEAISTCISLSATLRTSQIFRNSFEAFLSFEKDMSKCEWMKDMEIMDVIKQDLVDIINGSDGSDLFFCLKAAICDLDVLCSQTLVILKETKTNHLKRPLSFGKLMEGNSSKVTTITTSSARTNPDTKTRVNTSGNIKVVRELKCPKGSTAVAYTDDLDLLASGQEDGSILLFPKDGEPRMLLDLEMSLQGEPCTDLKIKSSPKGGYNKTLLAGYLSGHIKLWDTSIGKVLFTLKENRQLYGLRYHPRSHRFISVGNDFKVNVYDEETRVTERVLASSGIKGSKNGHTDSVCSAAFHPYNPFEIISGGVDNTIQFWDIRAPFAVRSIDGVSMYGDALDMSEDGKVILCGLSNTWESTIQVYDYGTGRLLKNHTKPGCFVYCCKFLSPPFVGIGGFYHHTFRIINMKMSNQVYGYVNGLPGCVMNFALCRKVPRFRTYPDKLPAIALSSGDKIFELQMLYPEERYESTDFYFKDQTSE